MAGLDVIKTENIEFYYDTDSEAKVIDNVSFGAPKGEFVSIIGPSGCGKSTLLRIIAGLYSATSGEVLYMGKPVTAPIPDISFVFQDFGLLPWLTNLENVKLGYSRHRLDNEQKERGAIKLLKDFGLEKFADSYPNVLSGGMKQRVGIARAIASSPKVLLMDEPFSSLDEITAETLRKDIVEMLQSKKISVNSVIMVTHNVEEAVELSNRVVVLSDKPSRVKNIDEIKLRYPRNRHGKDFLKLVDRLDSQLKL